MPRIGVFVCHCGHNIAGVVDVQAVVEGVKQREDVVFATDYKYMCSDPGQQLIRESIVKYELDGVVVAACSPAMHETTFRKTVAAEGLNPYRCESANIREQVSWVHQQEKEEATRKAIEIARSIAEKVKGNEALESLVLPLTRRTLVIGGGIAGMQAALDVADAGYPVILVEKNERLGGKMSRLSGTYLNFSAAPDMLKKKIARVLSHPNIQTLTQAEVVSLSGYVGNFQAAVISKEAPPAHEAPETGPAEAAVAEGDVSDEHEFHFEVGAIVVATGWQPYPLERLPEYGSGELPDVIDGLAFETMLASKEGIRRPSDGAIPQEVVFVQCAGSRDPEKGVPYCSKVCCMYVAKQAMFYKERVPTGQAYVFYIDIRSAGKGYDEYVQRAMTDSQVIYLRGKVSKVFKETSRPGSKVIVWGSDTLSDRAVEIAADLVVLATPMAPDPSAVELGQRLHISTDANGFYNEAHPKLRPVETLTAGIFLAGAGQGPKDIPESAAQASGAAAKVLQLFSHDEMTASPLVATVIAELCAACGACVKVCPYGARTIHPVWNIATVNAALCQSCGACVVACPNKASQVHNWRPEQILAMVDEVL
ncbi:MAG: CoB--CoM heterodisulfide reductase iron-sulfur subunit A family protein [Anaerolineales bacterium]|nr:CoB--CoM heterodisulfide reductase iron-sulfur subunit A family protein [Anaerolineales bacterium]